MPIHAADCYASATALATDVEQFLADKSVDACRPTPVERLGRWTRKHRSAVAVGGFGVATIAVVSLAAALVINDLRRSERQTARENLRLATAEMTARQQADQRFLQARETVDT